MTAKRPSRLSADDLDVIQLALIGSAREHTESAQNPTLEPEWKAWYERQAELEEHAGRVIRELRWGRDTVMHEANPMPPIRSRAQRLGDEFTVNDDGVLVLAVV